ncbi:MAG: DUF2237 domain-containing protein [Rhodospirillales bacterium]|jgi:uncharacterized protein (DUF2237 family)|nr:DUF2237 domain-containing protein [Rhodospirillales bacterium]|tara:strand:- start:228 stop:602 length:375 start_codon:yes stop_codon:yes gene_type:complete
MEEKQENVLGTELEICGIDPITGFYRDGCCNTGKGDVGTHTVCVIVTDEFLEFSRGKGNDLSTPIPNYGFPGLKAGDSWCLCALRWEEARIAGFAPRVKLTATNKKTLDLVKFDDLKEYQIDLN